MGWLDWIKAAPGYEQVAACFEYRNDLSGFINAENFLSRYGTMS